MQDLRQRMSNQIAQKWVKDVELAMITPLRLVKGYKVVKLTRWQKFKRFMTKRYYPGRWLTYKLMAHYDIYEGGDY